MAVSWGSCGEATVSQYSQSPRKIYIQEDELPKRCCIGSLVTRVDGDQRTARFKHIRKAIH